MVLQFCDAGKNIGGIAALPSRVQGEECLNICMPVDELDCVFHNWETQSVLGLAPEISMCTWYRAMLN